MHTCTHAPESSTNVLMCVLTIAMFVVCVRDHFWRRGFVGRSEGTGGNVADLETFSLDFANVGAACMEK